MSQLGLTEPIVFGSIFMERIWGGRHLESLYGKRLPPGRRIGESWEIVDRPEAQSIVREKPWSGRTLHDLWLTARREIFGHVPDSERFPLLIKLLDARERLSLQVHPPADAAAELGGEPKAEFWYVADAALAAEIYVGLKKESSRAKFEAALVAGTIEEHVHRVPVQAGDSMFLPSGRVHSIGAGLVIVEIQQNSDTTYRVFDWNRGGSDGKPRELHVEKSLRSIDFNDLQPGLTNASGESLMSSPHFEVEKWQLGQPRVVSEPESFAIIACLTGEIACAGISLRPGEVFLVPACLKDRVLKPKAGNTSLLRVMIGDHGRG